ncbi:hypothetical protein PMAYCL1PPCAC_24546 [Pristionchus mayeri]|uniref:K Homology domain-containing protein n=1 Tax=Pristionchus mayeri TaxID=1317129 RepID=A0AAN5D024_9BILA|nr:hypothetical protein PMAYCL1PPCAC_24546 [Pristionchus mayeri]
MNSSSEDGFHSTSSCSREGASSLTASSPSSSDYSGLQLGSAAAAALLQQQLRVDSLEQQMFSSTLGAMRGSQSSLHQQLSQMQHHSQSMGLASLGLNSSGGSASNRSDSGASSGAEMDDKGMKDERLPGAWFYESGETEASPTLHDDEFGLRAALSARNITETVEVPSSEHVAEIVGRQGCKIKALRAKTNTYIKTPIRGEEPVFTVTGRIEDVAEAKKEIELAADHFTQIRASRKCPGGGAVPGMNTPGHITAYVRVPLRVVGLVVGPKGATIKRIQQDTSTYIITPSREREPIFEVTGLPANVEVARKEIEQHIFQRTGNMPITDPSAAITSAEMQTVLQSAAARAKFTGGNQNSAAIAAAAYAAAVRHFGPGAAAADHASMMANEQFQMQSILHALNKGDGASMLAHSMHSPSLFPSHLSHHSAAAAHLAGLAPVSRSATPPMSIGLPPHASFGVPPPSGPWSAPLGIVTSSASNVMSALSSADSATCEWNAPLMNGAGWSMGMQPPSSSSRRAAAGMEALTARLHGMSLLPRDEGLGDSPPINNQLSNKEYSLMSSIWSSSDMENTAPKRVEGAGVAPVATA